MRRFLPSLVALACACGGLSATRRDLARSPYRVVTLSPLASAPGDSESGPLATRVLGTLLEDFGFTVAASSAEARGAVSGEVLELGEKLVTHPAAYEDRLRTYRDAAGKEQLFVDRILLKAESIEAQQVFRVRARLSDARTGETLWEGSTWVGPRRMTREEAVQDGLDTLLRRMARAAVGPSR